MGVHPIANFVVARALERADETKLVDTCQELEPVLFKLISEYDAQIMIIGTNDGYS